MMKVCFCFDPPHYYCYYFCCCLLLLFSLLLLVVVVVFVFIIISSSSSCCCCCCLFTLKVFHIVWSASATWKLFYTWSWMWWMWIISKLYEWYVPVTIDTEYHNVVSYFLVKSDYSFWITALVLMCLKFITILTHYEIVLIKF